MSTQDIEWDAGDFVSLVKARFGNEKASSIIPPLESINAKFDSCRSHARLALEKMRPHKNQDAKDHISQTIEAFKILFHQTDEEKKILMDSLHEAKDHVVAFGQCLHSTSDYLAKVIYSGMDLKDTFSSEIPNAQIGLYSIKKKIDSIAALAKVKSSIEAYVQAPAFQYLSAFVNTEKHHATVGASFALSFSASSVASGGVQIAEFEYERKGVGVERHQKKWATEFLDSDFEAILRNTLSIGQSLSETIRNI